MHAYTMATFYSRGSGSGRCCMHTRWLLSGGNLVFNALDVEAITDACIHNGYVLVQVPTLVGIVAYIHDGFFPEAQVGQFVSRCATSDSSSTAFLYASRMAFS